MVKGVLMKSGCLLPAKIGGYGCSSIGRVVVSKTIGCGFDSYHPCKTTKKWQNLVLLAT